MKRLAAELALLDTGEPVDLDGDGHPEAQERHFADGSSEFRSDHDGDGIPEYVRRDDGKGHLVTIVDADSDGRPEEITDLRTSETEQKRVVTRDRDRNGVMDHRSTWVVTRENPDIAIFTEEVDEDEDGIFEFVRTENLVKKSQALASRRRANARESASRPQRVLKEYVPPQRE